ncbi:MAG: hypothetical protein ACJ746_22320 [Bryobacteraceae bacterium]
MPIAGPMKLSPFFPICLGLIASAVANSQIATPSVGYVRYANDGVRGIYGLEGNYVVGDKVLALALSASFSDDGGLLFQSGSLALVDSSLTTIATLGVSDSDAVIRIDRGLETAIAWLPASHALVHWNGKSFAKTTVSALPAEATVTSVRKLDRNTASLLVSKPDSTIVRCVMSLQTGDLKTSMSIPAAFGMAFEDGARIICFSKRKLSVLSQTGEILQELTVPTDDGLLVEQASTRCLHLNTRTPGQDWLLHTDGKDFHLYQLPGPRKGAVEVSEAKLESAK